MTSDQEKAKQIIDSISDLIRANQRMIGQEMYAPRSDSDYSDDLIDVRTRYVEKLRAIRTSLEDLFTGLVG